MDRRTIWAILIMMVIAVAPALFLKKPAPRPAGREAGDTAAVTPSPTGSSAAGAADSSPRLQPVADSSQAQAAMPAAPGDTVRVTSPLYTYGFSPRGATLVEARLHRYASMAPGQQGERAQIMPQGSDLLGLTEREIEHSRAARRQLPHRDPEREGVVPHIPPRDRRVRLQRIELVHGAVGAFRRQHDDGKRLPLRAPPQELQHIQS